MTNRFKHLVNPTLSGAFLTVFGAMLWTIHSFGTSLPYNDEWGAEGSWLYRYYENGSLGISEIFAPHNGHRIVLTRLAALFFYVINGGWDPQLQMILSAFLHATICTLLIRIVLLDNREPSRVLFIAYTVALFAVPFSWISITVAFQTQFYFMIFFAVLGLYLFSSSRYFSGYLCSALSMLSMTPGGFVLLAYSCTSAVRAISSQQISRNQAVHCLTALLLFILYVLTLHEEPAARVYYAQHISGFVISFLVTINWPHGPGSGVGIFIYFPLFIYVIRDTITPPPYIKKLSLPHCLGNVYYFSNIGNLVLSRWHRRTARQSILGDIDCWSLGKCNMCLASRL